MANQIRKYLQWWTAGKDAKHDLVFKWVRYCAKELSTLRRDTTIFASVCNNFAPTGNDEYDYAIRSAFKHKIRDNILLAGVDTAVSMIALARTAPRYLTTGGDWDTSRKCEKKSRVMQSQMYEHNVFQFGPKSFRQACEGGSGWTVTTVGPDNKPLVRRPLHNEIVWDPEDGRYADPRMVAWIHFEDRDELLKQCGDNARLKKIVEEAAGPTGEDYSDFFIRRSNQADRVRVVYVWRLPTVDRGDDGLFVRCVSSGTLEERPHRRRRHKVVRWLFAERDQGYAGQSLVERMLPAQMQLAETDAYIAKTQYLGSNAKTYTFRNSGVTPDQVSNAAVQTLEVADPSLVPVTVVSSATPPDLVQHRESIKQDAYDAQGFGDQTVTGDVNKGLASGEAVRQADDVKVRRFLNPAGLLEQGYMAQTRALEDTNDECAERDENYMVRARNRAGTRTWVKDTRWKDMQFDESSDPTIQMLPISAQATTAAARVERVDEYISRGFMSKPQAMDQIENPDTAAFETLENADLDLVHEQLDALVDLEDANPDMLLPIAEQDLEMAAYYAKKAKLVAWRMKAPDEVLMRFDRYLADVRAKQQLAAPAAAPAPAALNPAAAAAAAMQQPAMPAPVAA